MSGRRHEAGRQGRSLPSSRSQSGMRAGVDVRRDDGATARGRAPWTESPLLSLPVRDASRRRRPPKMTGRRHEAGRQGRSLPSSRSQSGMRAGDDVRRDDGATARGRAPECFPPPPLAPSQGCEQGTTMVVPRRYSGDNKPQEYFRPGRP